MKLPINEIICGDTLVELKKLPGDSIDMMITSPPYWGLRNYHTKNQIGLEDTFEEYLNKMIAIMAEVKRVIKSTGQIWVNFGDCYASSGSNETRFWHGENQGKHKLSNDNYSGRARCENYPSKCMLMMPERFAIRCIDELGLILRNKVKWAKQVLVKNKTIGSVMPTSVKDRFNESGEELYFFVKQKKYYSDLDAVRLSYQVMGITDFRNPDGLMQTLYKDSKYRDTDYSPQKGNQFNYRVRDAKRKKGQPQFKATKEEIKNYQGKFAGKKDVEQFNSPRARTQRNWRQEEAEGYKMGSVDSHRAALRGGLKQWRNKTAKDPNARGARQVPGPGESNAFNVDGKNIPTIWNIQSEPHNFNKELGLEVEHFAIFPQALLEIPIKFGCPSKGIILDPFMGSGTTALVAQNLGRNFVGIEINKKYIEIAKKRLAQKPMI